MRTLIEGQTALVVNFNAGGVSVTAIAAEEATTAERLAGGNRHPANGDLVRSDRTTMDAPCG